MADYTAIDPNSLLPGQPITSALGQALEENPRAIIDGAPGAPRANGRMAATTLEYATDNPLTGLSAGDLNLPNAVFEQTTFADTSTNSGTFQSAGICEISFRATGTLRFLATQIAVRQSPVQFSACEIRILKNSTVIETWSLSAPGADGAASALRSVDISAASGDIFEWEVRRISPSGGSPPPDVTIDSILVRADDTYTTRPLPIKVSEL